MYYLNTIDANFITKISDFKHIFLPFFSILPLLA